MSYGIDEKELISELDAANNISRKYIKLLSKIVDIEKSFKSNSKDTLYWKGVRDTLDTIEEVIKG